MGIRPIEIKREYIKEGEREFIFEQTTINIIIDWSDAFFDEKSIKEWIKKNPIPKDKYFNFEEVKQDFNSEGYINIICEKKETAGWFANLLYELI